MDQQKTNNWFAINFTSNRRITPLLVDFFESWSYNPKIGNALDIGFWIGQDSRYLAEKWYLVDAIDNDSIAIEKAKQFNNHTGITFLQIDISTFVFSKTYDLVIAFLSLFTIQKKSAQVLFAAVIEHLNVDWYFMMRLLWPHDDRAQKITCWEKSELEQLFLQDNRINIVFIHESFEDKATASWSMKHRHFIDVLLQKII